MDINNIAAKAQRMENVGDLFPIVSDIVEYLQQHDRDLNDTLANLTSENITEIDFGRTRIKNLNLGGAETNESV